jgi:hypothetical protein
VQRGFLNQGNKQQQILLFYLEFAAFNNFSISVFQLENVKATGIISEVYPCAGINLGEIYYFFTEEIKYLESIGIVR